MVEKNWSAVPSRLTMTPEADSAAVGSCNAFTITASDRDGKPVQGVVIDVEQRHERSGNTTANDEPRVSFCRPSEGPNRSDVDQTRGDLGSQEQPNNEGTAGGEAVQITDVNGQVTIGITVTRTQGSDGTGNVLVTAFYENEDNDDPDTGEPQDSSTKTWTPAQGRTIDCNPEQATNPVNTDHTVTCLVRDRDGDPAEGEGVTFTEEGPGEFTTPQQQTTNSQGEVRAIVRSSEEGEQKITATLSVAGQGEPDTDECERAAGDPAGAPAGNCSDEVSKVWTAGRVVQRGPCAGFAQGSRQDRQGGGQIIVGTSGPDEIQGSSGDDLICGLGGDDTITANAGDDEVYGNAGKDGIGGGAGNDQIFGGQGKDLIRGGDNQDVVNGGKKNDNLSGGDANDVIRGNAGFDTIKGNSGDDRLRGATGDDILQGGGGNDNLKAGSGNDVVKGFTGNDTLVGHAGDDILRGGDDDDRLFGGAGDDLLNGGNGRDTCRGGPGSDSRRRC